MRTEGASGAARFGLHAAAVLYSGGALAQLLKLVFDFPWQEMPYAVDWGIIVLGSIGATTLLLLTSRIAYRGWWEKPVHFLIIAHLYASVGLHVWTISIRSHDFYGSFPREYSYFALLYFAFFAWRSWTVELRER